MEQLLAILRESLTSITNPHFFETEMGYQGELVGELRNRLQACEINGAVVRQEYQKRMRDHGVRVRPDIIIHIPFEQADFATRREGNFVVIELKLRASEAQAVADYEKLAGMCEVLNYPIGVFVNIGSNETYLDSYDGEFRDRLRGYSVEIAGDTVVLQERNVLM